MRLSKIGICSDFRSVLECIGSWGVKKSKHPLIYDIKLEIDLAEREGLQVTLLWVPGHCDINGNEMADSLVKLGALSTEPPPFDYLLPEDLIHNTNKEFQILAHKHLETQFESKETRYNSHIKILSEKPWFEPLQHINRKVISLMTRIRSYHIATGPHLLDKNIIKSKECPCGFDIRDWRHILFFCPDSQEEADKLISKLHRYNFSTSNDIHIEAFLNNIGLFTEIAKFLNNTHQVL